MMPENWERGFAMSKANSSIELVLPFGAEYVSIARLTASGVASRIGFDIETIEDIKVAIAEVCNKLVKTGSHSAHNYKIVFDLETDRLDVRFYCDDNSLKCIFNDPKDLLGLSIINALMDKVEFCMENEYLLTMSKSVEGKN